MGRAEADETDRILELQQRVEAMERQNRALMRALQERRILSVDDNVDDGMIRQVDENEEDIPTELFDEDAHFRNLIREYIDSQKKPAPAEPEWYEVGSDLTMHAGWRYGLEIETKNKDFRVHVGGRTQFDSGWFTGSQAINNSLPPNARFRDGVDFRRARLRVDGTMYETMEWASEWDFVNSAGAPTTQGVVAPTDLWWTFKEIPIFQNLRVGNQKEPIGFEHMISSRFLPFMERSFLQDAFFGGFNNGFNPGATLFGTAAEERMTWSAGVFNPTSNVFAFNTGAGEYNLLARLTALPVYIDDGRGLVHLGVTVKESSLDNRALRTRTRASVRSSLSAEWPIIADTGFVTADSGQTINTELAVVAGPLSIVAEYLTLWLQKSSTATLGNVGTVVYRGGYVEALYFLTGENRTYNRKIGAFDREFPAENAFLVKDEEGDTIFGRGAWQVGARYQFLDLNDNGVSGGILHDTTLGINWFLNPNFKIQANYFYLDRQGPGAKGNGVEQGFGMRLAHDF